MFSASVNRFFHTLLTVTLLASLGFILGCGKKEITEAEVLETARMQADAGGYTPAIATLENYLTDHPGAFAVIDALAFTALEAGDQALAALYFQRAAEVDPSQPEYLLLAANAMADGGDNSGAAAAYREYLTVRPADSGAWVQLAELNANLGNRSAALDAYLQANRIQPSGAVQVAIGQNYLAAGNLAQSQIWFATAAQAEDEARPAALLGLLEIALRANRYTDAQALIQTLDTEAPGYLDESHLAQSRADLAAWQRKQNEAAEAVAALNNRPQNTAQSGSSPSPDTSNQSSGTASTEVADADRATEESTTAEASASTQATTPDSGGPVAATTDPTEASAEVTNEDEADKDLAVTDVEADTAEEAETATNETIAPSSGVTEVFRSPRRTYEEFVSLARAQVMDGEFSEAIRNFQRALARQNSDPEIWLELSEAQFQAGENVRAPASASEAVRRAPNNPKYFLQYIRVSAPTNPLARTIRELEAAQNRFPESPAVALTLARAYEDQGSLNYARRMYEIFLTLASSNHPDRPEVEARLGR
jgi:tetratricopeptide (TPR) repeat protein